MSAPVTRHYFLPDPAHAYGATIGFCTRCGRPPADAVHRKAVRS